MCILVDANLAALVFSRPAQSDFEPLLDWLLNPDKDGRLVLGGLLAAELGKVDAVRRMLVVLRRAGRATLVESSKVAERAKELKAEGLCRSNDHHVVALATVSGARLLCTRDRALQEDFRDADLVSNPRGSVYQRREHAHLLRHSRSCGHLQPRTSGSHRGPKAKRR